MSCLRFARRFIRSQYEFSATRICRIVFCAIILGLFPIGNSLAELVGTIPGQFSVSTTGAATYQIPIDAPTATGGMQPNISLIYNHGGGTGIAGQGWTVGGISKITRCPLTLAQDNEIRGVKFDWDDRYCLDGQRLILISGTTYGEDGAEYRTEIETFQKIVSISA